MTAGSPGRLTYDEWAEALRDGRLLGQRCGACGHETAAPKAACARCGSDSLQEIELPTDGEVHSETRTKVPPKAFEGEYTIVIVSLEEAKVMGHVDSEVDIGDPVRLAGVVDAAGLPGPKFETV